MVRRVSKWSGLCLFGYLFGCLFLARGEGGSLQLFNGRDLSGWQTVGTAEWKVVGGRIVGGQFGDSRKSGLLMTEQAFRDFDLELEFKIDEHGKYNSGVYLRHVAGERRRRGYQINIGRAAAEEYIGLYTDRWLAKGDEMDRFRKVLEWNHLRIRAVGPHIEVWLNGQSIVDFRDPNAAPGFLEPVVIAFQTYGAEGHAGWVEFRSISIRVLSLIHI